MESVLVKNAGIKNKFFACSAFMLTMWLFYGLCWGLSEGGNVLSPDAESIFYGLLDLLSSPFYGAVLLWVAHSHPELHLSE
jgi:bacteriorhodopsin